MLPPLNHNVAIHQGTPELFGPCWLEGQLQWQSRGVIF